MNKKLNNNSSPSNAMDERLIFELADLFKIFCDSTRVKILCLLMDGEKNVTEISQNLCMTQPAISQQLRILKNSSLVKYRRDGKSIFYSLADGHVEKILSIGIEHLTE